MNNDEESNGYIQGVKDCIKRVEIAQKLVCYNLTNSDISDIFTTVKEFLQILIDERTEESKC